MRDNLGGEPTLRQTPEEGCWLEVAGWWNDRGSSVGGRGSGVGKNRLLFPTHDLFISVAGENTSCPFFTLARILRGGLPTGACKAGDMHRKTCIFSGRVQGVGFRYTALNIAQQYNVKGYVRNLADGRVEMVLEGPPEEIDSTIEAIRDRLEGFILNVDSDLLPATGEFGRFQIRH